MFLIESHGRSLPTSSSHLFDDSHDDRHEVISHCGFDLHFPSNKWCRAPIHVTWPFISLLWTFLIGNVVVCYWVAWVLYIFWIITHHQIFGLQIFPHFIGCHEIVYLCSLVTLCSCLKQLFVADSCWCLLENSKVLYSNYPSVKK